jgi:hypothetical protein
MATKCNFAWQLLNQINFQTEFMVTSTEVAEIARKAHVAEGSRLQQPAGEPRQV